MTLTEITGQRLVFEEVIELLHDPDGVMAAHYRLAEELEKLNGGLTMTDTKPKPDPVPDMSVNITRVNDQIVEDKTELPCGCYLECNFWEESDAAFFMCDMHKAVKAQR